MKNDDENNLSAMPSQSFSEQGVGGSSSATSTATANQLADVVSRLNDLETQAKGALGDAKEALRRAESAQSVVVYGFFALVVVVIGLCFGYFMYISSDSIRYQSDLAGVHAMEKSQKKTADELKEKIVKVENENKDFQKVISCLKGRKSWEIDICFE